MAIVETTFSNAVNSKLNNGTIDGKVQTVNVGLGKLSAVDSSWDAQKVMNIVPILENCLTKEVYQVERTKKTRLTDES